MEKFRVLIVCSGKQNKLSPFVEDQIKSLLAGNMIEVDYFLIRGRGTMGYLGNLTSLKRQIDHFRPDLIHAHFGLSGLLSVLQRNVPVVVTFHGSDVHQKKNWPFSKVASLLATSSIFVSLKLKQQLGSKLGEVIPCGVDCNVFFPREKSVVRKRLGLSEEKFYVLFSSKFTNSIKNYPLAKLAIQRVKEKIPINVELIELNNYSRTEVGEIMNAVDVALMTSFEEGSPQFIKEALASNCPIVSTDVGDVKYLIAKTPGCFVTDHNVDNVVDALLNAFSFVQEHGRTQGATRIAQLNLDNDIIASAIYKVYQNVLLKKIR